MSECRQAITYVEALEAHLAELRQTLAKNPINFDYEGALDFFLAAIKGEVNITMEKLRSRCTMVDPVTNQPRFGPQMLTKVQDLLRRYDDVKLAIHEDALLRLEVEAKIFELKNREAAKKEEEAAREKERKAAERAVTLARAVEKQILQQEAESQKAKEQEKEKLRIESLALAAQKKRDLRKKERAEEERQRKQQEEERNFMNASIPFGKEGLEESIMMLRESTNNQACSFDVFELEKRDYDVLFHQSLEKLFHVLSNICSSPENAAFRHIPKENANFHADLGQYSGGHQCLLALGFKEVEQKEDDTQTKTVFVLEVSGKSSCVIEGALSELDFLDGCACRNQTCQKILKAGVIGLITSRKCGN
ncbi:hypothetical protein PsorP6_005041 [Peronosclerospora sorghi]|uniref:Uncharacterized protein n=1 Tax=Peronosclerospora sorghi TaxID=230839 RepID=A0ACC0W530_9STRA|nr:hypothetical protein PsorP6_005041 [Peronosclerospora sorghi]